jgi:alpha-galactosidase
MLSLLLHALLASPTSAVNNGLARTPQMGWNNWNSLGCDVSQALLLDTSRVLLDSGLRDVGYNYVVLDDCWSDGRGSDGYIIVDKHKFPQGMKWVAKQLHNMGFLYGMYSSAGELTCARYEGSLDHEKEDAQSFASWDVDYLKYDNCYHKGRFGYPEVSFNRYNVMWEALNATGRPILYSLCSWGEDYVHTWGMSIANSWRVSGDIYDSFSRPDDLCSCTDATNPHCIAPGSHCSVLNIINKVAPYVDRGQYGGWNDLDMLEVGLGGMTDEEYKAHFSMWAAIKSPLLIGADLRELSAQTLSILNNPAVIAVNQDPLGKSAYRISRNLNIAKDKYGIGETQIWSGPLYQGDQLVVFLNAADEDMEMSATLDEIFVMDGPEGSAAQTKQRWNIYDLWAKRMDQTTAEQIVESGIARPEFKKENWYNSTELPYAEGLKAGDKRLLGQQIGKVCPGGQIKAKVPRHAVKMYRLRSMDGGAKRYSIYKQEL